MNGETALHLSVYSGQLLLIEQLIDKASTGDKGNGFVDASGVVEPNSKAGNNDGGGHIRNKFIDAQTNDGETALMLAASRNQPAIVCISPSLRDDTHDSLLNRIIDRNLI
jgi:ankyrin repeat protein